MAGNIYRKINNEQAGQIFLAIIGKPFWCKTNKKKIFSDADYYKVIFKVDLERNERFTNSNLNLISSNISVQTGVSNFTSDVIFGFSIYKLADGLKAIYRDKIKSYPEEKSLFGDIKTAYSILNGRYQFYNYWHYFLISCIYEVMQKWVGFGKDIDQLKTILTGADKNKIFENPKNIAQLFNPNNDQNVFIILDENEASKTHPTFAVWAQCIADELANLFKEEIRKPNVKAQSFVDQTPETFKKIQEWISELRTGGEKKFSEKFPLLEPKK